MLRALRPYLYESSAQLAAWAGSKRRFMNLGYEAADALPVHAGDEPEAHHIRLYLKMLSQVPVTPHTSALEIGCGRGGGCHVLRNYLGLNAVRGLDLSKANLKQAKKLIPGVSYLHGNAAELAVTGQYDLVVNLESSHAYPSRADFFRRVAQALKPGGWFAFGDLLRRNSIPEVESHLRSAGFRIHDSANVTQGVIRSIEHNSRKQYPLVTRFPFLLPLKLHGFLVTIHSRVFKRLSTGEVEYRVYAVQKAA